MNSSGRSDGHQMLIRTFHKITPLSVFSQYSQTQNKIYVKFIKSLDFSRIEIKYACRDDVLIDKIDTKYHSE